MHRSERWSVGYRSPVGSGDAYLPKPCRAPEQFEYTVSPIGPESKVWSCRHTRADGQARRRALSFWGLGSEQIARATLGGPD